MAKLLAIGLATNQTRVFNMAFSEPASTIYHARRLPALPPGHP